MALKYSLLSGAEMSGSRGGFCLVMRASITYPLAAYQESLLAFQTLKKGAANIMMVNAKAIISKVDGVA